MALTLDLAPLDIAEEGGAARSTNCQSYSSSSRPPTQVSVLVVSAIVAIVKIVLELKLAAHELIEESSGRRERRERLERLLQS